MKPYKFVGPQIDRIDGRFWIRDDSAGYTRELTLDQLSRIAAKAADLLHIHIICEAEVSNVVPPPQEVPFGEDL